MAPIGKQEIQSPYICASKEKLVTNREKLVGKSQNNQIQSTSASHTLFIDCIRVLTLPKKAMNRGTLAIAKW